jgi:hypothetical protein
MDLDQFWTLIEQSRTATNDADERIEWLTERLATLPLRDIEDFQLHLDGQRQRVDTGLVWGAAYQIMGGLCSDDRFAYFQTWLVGLGRAEFERVAAAPDTLADVPAIQHLAGRDCGDWADDEWPEWEALDYVAGTAHERHTGEEESMEDALEARDHERPADPDPVDDQWDFEDPEEVARRLPRIHRMFPLAPRAERDAQNKAVFDGILRERGQTEEEFFAPLRGDRR